jgi:ribonuclease D
LLLPTELSHVYLGENQVNTSVNNKYMVDTEREFTVLVERALNTDCVALDTEFVWERTYYPRLGLIQLAMSDEECYLIDPLAIKDLTPLGALLSTPNVVKILHDAPQDLTILSRVTGTLPTNIFDTRLAAGFSGLSSTISLVDLVSVLLDINLEKTQTRTNWLNRPLNAEQVDYALDDVRYLRALRVLLLTRIVVPEIKSWLKEELEGLNQPRVYGGIDDRQRFLKIKGNGSLNGKSLSILRELAAWREQEARHINRPRGHVVTDKALMAMAKENPHDVDELMRSGHLSHKKLNRYDRAILKSIETGRSINPDEYPIPKRPLRLNNREKTAYDRLNSFVQLKCDMQGIDSQLIGSTSELKQLAININNPGSPLPEKLTGGWRKIFLEEFFRQRS